MNDTGIIILAAGSSTRLAKPKQLLLYRGKFLIQHIAVEALSANLHPVVIVTGACAQKVSAVLKEEKTKIVYNEHWQQGMASGIVAGLSKMLSLNPAIKSTIIAVCDQPFLSAQLLLDMVEKKVATGKSIVACEYADTVGIPVLFSQKYFEEFLQLKGEEGAKKLLRLYKNDLATVSFPQGSIDIDTAEDYEGLLNEND